MINLINIKVKGIPIVFMSSNFSINIFVKVLKQPIS